MHCIQTCNLLLTKLFNFERLDEKVSLNFVLSKEKTLRNIGLHEVPMSSFLAFNISSFRLLAHTIDSETYT